MTSSIFSVNIKSNADQALSNIFPLTELTLPASLAFRESTLHLSEASKELASGAELVVFDSLTLSQLFDIQHLCNCQVIQLNKFNQRLNRTSLRFDIACDDLSKARKALTQYCLAAHIEAAIVKDAPQLSTPGVLVMDMDSTTIEIECIDEIAKLAGVGEQVAEVTERAMLGELDFAQSLHQRVATLENAPEQILAEVAKHIPLMECV